LKEDCFVFDFAPERALRQVTEYSCSLNTKEKDNVKKVEDFINFLPILSYEGSCMKQLDASEILDFVSSGTTATLLAKK